jgi:hypothetical protein
MRRLLLLASVLLALFSAVVLPRPAQAAPLSKPVITVQVADKTVRNDEPVTLRAHATGHPEPTVVWEISRDGGKTFTRFPMENHKDTIDIGKSNPDFNGLQFRATFSNSQGTATTNTGILTVLFRPRGSFTNGNQSVKVGEVATFAAVALGNPKPTVQWQVKAGNRWADIPGATMTDNITFAPSTETTYKTPPAQLFANGWLFRAKFTNMFGSEETNAATLTVTP